jgi:hypothetical protein
MFCLFLICVGLPIPQGIKQCRFVLLNIDKNYTKSFWDTFFVIFYFMKNNKIIFAAKLN